MPQNEVTAATAHDPYTRIEAAVVEPPSTFGQAFRQIGPGLILTASIVGTGELIATTDLGAKAGFVLLWLVIVSCFIKVFVQIEMGRYAISSGETTLETFKAVPGIGNVLCWWWFIMMLLTQMQIGAMIGGVGQTFVMAAPDLTSGLQRPEMPWAVLAAVLAAVLLVRGTYRLIQRTTTLLVAFFTLMTLVCLIMLPFTEYAFSWTDLATGFTFQIPLDDEIVLMAAFAMIGITGVGASELIAYPYWCIEKGYARNVGPRQDTDAWLHRARGWFRVLQLDSWTSMAIYTAATVAFFLLGAAVLNQNPDTRGLEGGAARVLSTLSQMYAPVLGEMGATWFIGIGAFVVLFSTLFAATAANSRTTTDFLMVQNIVKLREYHDRRVWVQFFCVFFPTLGLVLFYFFENPVEMVAIGGIAQAITLPIIAGVALYLRYTQTDHRLRPGNIWSILLWLSMMCLFAAAAYGLITQIGKLTN